MANSLSNDEASSLRTKQSLFRSLRKLAHRSISPQPPRTPPKNSSGIDSGYVSTTGTPTGSETAADSTKRPSPLSVMQFRQQPPEAALNRFQDFEEQWGESFLTHLYGESTRRRAVSMRLKMVGPNATAAKPCIVICCEKHLLKAAKTFLRRKEIREMLQPVSPGPDIVTLELYVSDQPPKLAAAPSQIDIFSFKSWLAWSTLCGMPVKSSTFHATMGGLIMVDDELYGITAGHIYDSTTEKGDDVSRFESLDDDEESDSALFISNGLAYDIDQFEMPEASTYQPDDTEDRNWVKIGHAPVNQVDGLDPRSELDYILVQLDELDFILPNMIFSDEDHSKELRGPESATDTDKLLLSGRRVQLATDQARQDPKLGCLKSSTAYLSIGRKNKFIGTYTLELDSGIEIDPGNSGSWVADQETNEVYGHVIANDGFGDAYVVPLSAVMRDIETQYGASSVYLPTAEDVITWLNKHTSSKPLKLRDPVQGNKKSQTSQGSNSSSISKSPGTLMATPQTETHTNQVSRLRSYLKSKIGSPPPFIPVVTYNTPAKTRNHKSSKAKRTNYVREQRALSWSPHTVFHPPTRIPNAQRYTTEERIPGFNSYLVVPPPPNLSQYPPLTPIHPTPYISPPVPSPPPGIRLNYQPHMSANRPLDLLHDEPLEPSIPNIADSGYSSVQQSPGQSAHRDTETLTPPPRRSSAWSRTSESHTSHSRTTFSRKSDSNTSYSRKSESKTSNQSSTSNTPPGKNRRQEWRHRQEPSSAGSAPTSPKAGERVIRRTSIEVAGVSGRRYRQYYYD